MKSPDKRLMADADAVLAALTITTFAMASLAETRDSDSGQHIQRIQHYVKALVQRLQTLPQLATVLTEAYSHLLIQSAPLYDMGTIGIPDRILLKPGRLTLAELVIMRTHPTLARDAIEHAEASLGCRAELLQSLKEMAYSHQEKWDGSGYPQGLSGTQIPLSARLIALADVYDALISDRVYKAGVPHEQAVGIIFGERGSHFDPDLVDAFMEIHDEFHAIARRFADTEQDMQKKMEYMANAIAEIAEL